MFFPPPPHHASGMCKGKESIMSSESTAQVCLLTTDTIPCWSLPSGSRLRIKFWEWLLTICVRPLSIYFLNNLCNACICCSTYLIVIYINVHYMIGSLRFPPALCHLISLDTRKKIFTGRWSSTGTQSPGRWSWPQSWSGSTTLESGVGLNDFSKSLPTQVILWFYSHNLIQETYNNSLPLFSWIRCKTAVLE